MEPIELLGVVQTGAAKRFVQAAPPPVDGYPAGTRLVLGIVVDPNQPGQVAPFTLIERPTATGWRTEAWQPADLQDGRLPEEAAGESDPDEEDFLLRPLTLLGLDQLQALPPEPTQPFREAYDHAAGGCRRTTARGAPHAAPRSR